MSYVSWLYERDVTCEQCEMLRSQGAQRPSCEECIPELEEPGGLIIEVFTRCVPCINLHYGTIDMNGIKTIIDIFGVQDKLSVLDHVLACCYEYMKIKSKEIKFKEKDGG